MKLFIIDTGAVVVRRSFDVLPYPEAILKKVENWGKRGKWAILRGRTDFLNQKGETFDWDKDDLANLQAGKEQPKLIHPDVIVEVPWVKTEDMYDKIIGPTPIGDEEKSPLYAERALKVRKNAGLDTDNQAQGVDKKQDEVIVNDNGDNDVAPGVFLKDDPISRLSVSGEGQFPWQEMVNLDKINKLPDEGEALDCGKRKITPRTLFSPRMKGKTHRSKAVTGVGFSHII